jgi:hypothetical protein
MVFMIKKKQITIDDLAVMIQDGFSETNERFGEMNKRFDRVETRLDRIENVRLGGHEQRIERLEDGILQVKTALQIKAK